MQESLEQDACGSGSRPQAREQLAGTDLASSSQEGIGPARALAYADDMAHAVTSSWLACAPSMFSLLRVLLAVSVIFLPAPWRVSAVLIAAGSDLIDGFLARRFAVTSWQGGLIDAVADKLFALILLVVLTTEGTLESWEAVLLLLRDLTVGLVAIYVVFQGDWTAFRRMPSRLPGRVTTAAMFVLLLILLAEPDQTINKVAIAMTIGLSGLAAMDYAHLFVRELLDHPAHSSA